MKYKILLLAMDDEKRPLWESLMVEPKGVSSSQHEYETESVDELKIKLKELLAIRGADTIKVINEVDYTLLIDIV